VEAFRFKPKVDFALHCSVDGKWRCHRHASLRAQHTTTKRSTSFSFHYRMFSPRADADTHARRCADAHPAGHRAASHLIAHHSRRPFRCLRARISLHPLRMSLLHFNRQTYRTCLARAGQHREGKTEAAIAATSNVSRHAYGAQDTRLHQWRTTRPRGPGMKSVERQPGKRRAFHSAVAISSAR
jgi:hypothetical protein